MLLWTLRSLSAFILGVLLFLAFLAYVVVGPLSGKLLDREVYVETLREQQVYPRIYSEVLPDPLVRDRVEELLGDTEAVSYEDLLAALSRVLPPEYLQEQTEQNLRRAGDYFSGETDFLELYLDLSLPLDRLEPALLTYLDQRVDDLDLVEPDPRRTEGTDEIRDWLRAALRDLGQGRIPRSVPSLEHLQPASRARAYDEVLGVVLADEELDLKIRNSLRIRSPEMRREFLAGDTRALLKQVARAVATPALMDLRSRVAARLDRQGRLDLVATLAREETGSTEAEIRRSIQEARDRFNRARFWGRVATLALVVTLAVLLGLVYVPDWPSVLRWPGVALLCIGGFTYGLGRVLEGLLSAYLRWLAEQALAGPSDLPPSVAVLVRDALTAWSHRVMQGVTGPALVLALIGLALFAASWLGCRRWRRCPGPDEAAPRPSDQGNEPGSAGRRSERKGVKVPLCQGRFRGNLLTR